jgi:hypothetical protein
VGFGMQYACEMLLTEAQLGFRVAESDGEVGVGAEGFRRKLRLYLSWLHSTISPLAGTQANEGQFIIFTALDLECAPVGPVRNDGLPKLPQLQRRAQPVGVNCRQVANDLLEQSFKAFHDQFRPYIEPRWCLQPPGQEPPAVSQQVLC